MDLAHEEGEGLGMEVLLNILPIGTAPIEEDILLAGVSMHINEHPHALLLALSQNHLLEVVYLGVVLLTWVFPPSIEIYSRSAEAEVAMAHSIDIDHGHDLKEKPLLEKSRRLTFRCQFLEKTFHNEGSYCLPGVHSGRKHHYFLAGEVAHVDEGYVDALKRAGDGLHLALRVDAGK